jgi:serine/threonine protein kinase
MTPELLRVAGRYEIHRLLGRGGMASVHLARQPALDREVALKELHSDHVRDAAFAHRFLNESRVAGALNHPSIVSVIEYFEHEGVPFIAMEYLERGSLRPLVGTLSLPQVTGVLGSVLGGLAEAAAQGIVHRDLKPENVLVTADGHAKVADFGIAKALGQLCMTDFRTATGQIVGTPAYMAPEQISGGEITPQVDLYATGLIAYELLTGRHPFGGTDAPMALLMRHVNDDPPPLASARPDLPPGVVAWVHAMLAKEPAARPAGAAHAWDRLEGVVSDALGPRWRRAATLTEPAPAPAVDPEPAPPAERSGLYSIALPPVPDPAEPDPDEVPTTPSNPVLHAPAAESASVLPDPVVPAALPEPALPEPALPEPALPEPALSEPAQPARSHQVLSATEQPETAVLARRPRRRALALALAAILLVAIAAILYSTAPGEEPRAAQRPAPRPAGPSLDVRLRGAVAPALDAGGKLSTELSALVPGADPRAARDRALPAIVATETADTAVRELRVTTASERLLRARARRALSAQSAYLEVVRDALRLRADDRQLDALGGLSARLVSRLERIETAVPGASATVGGARRLKRWVSAEVAAQAPPATLPAAPDAQPFEPAPAATTTPAPVPTAEPTPAPTASVDESAKPRPPLPRRRRARLRRQFDALVAPVPAP